MIGQNDPRAISPVYREGVSSSIVLPSGILTRTSPCDKSGAVLRSPDGETFDNIQPRQFGFVARSVRTGERVTFAAHGSEAVEVERLPRPAPSHSRG